MYEVKVRSQFSSAHNLRGYKGKCEDLHGHNWRVEVVVRAEGLDSVGMVVDFKEIKDLLNQCVAGLDHKHLNELESFKDVNPTSENIARYIHETISGEKPGLDIKEVTVYETDTSSATYSK
ncbi:MAG: 6-carboxytetrahydropterin synthase QueD [Candidatus Omnitrophota bacterium]